MIKRTIQILRRVRDGIDNIITLAEELEGVDKRQLLRTLFSTPKEPQPQGGAGLYSSVYGDVGPVQGFGSVYGPVSGPLPK